MRPTPPECHGPMKLCCSRGWNWRCQQSTCCKMTKVIIEQCFLNGSYKCFSTMVAIYCWRNGYTPEKTIKESGLKAFVVDDCTEATLTSNMQQNVKPNTNVDSDGWRGYYNLGKMQYNHGVVNNKKEFGRKIGQRTITDIANHDWTSKQLLLYTVVYA